MRRKLFNGEHCKYLLYSVRALQIITEFTLTVQLMAFYTGYTASYTNQL